jgi:hypothetical protein
VLPPRAVDDDAESPWGGVLVLAFLAAATAAVLVWKPGDVEARGVRSPRATPPRNGDAGPAEAVRGTAPPPPPKLATTSPTGGAPTVDGR